MRIYRIFQLKNRQEGQAVTEFLFLFPLYFFVLWGVVFLFRQQMRSLTDFTVISSLEMADAAFPASERNLAAWPSGKEETASRYQRMTHAAFHPSTAFLDSVDMKEGVFADKLVLTSVESHVNCDNDEPSYTLTLSAREGEIRLLTCAGVRSYESSPMAPVREWVEDFGTVSSTEKGTSLFLPPTSFSFLRRPSLALFASTEFSTSPAGRLFARLHAAPFPGNEGIFVSRCFMEPLSPQCVTNRISGKFSRTAGDSANLQVGACFLEGSRNCLASGPAMGACLEGVVSSLQTALANGLPAPVCPFLNRSVLMHYRKELASSAAWLKELVWEEDGIATDILKLAPNPSQGASTHAFF